MAPQNLPSDDEEVKDLVTLYSRCAGAPCGELRLRKSRGRGAEGVLPPGVSGCPLRRAFRATGTGRGAAASVRDTLSLHVSVVENHSGAPQKLGSGVRWRISVHRQRISSRLLPVVLARSLGTGIWKAHLPRVPGNRAISDTGGGMVCTHCREMVVIPLRS